MDWYEIDNDKFQYKSKKFLNLLLAYHVCKNYQEDQNISTCYLEAPSQYLALNLFKI